ncbi:MAG: nucleotidyltransferase domain-containing protein [Verrucomicrobiota bacterium]|nr:nucleotidyltransferase domain-containing protein [Verrucomicrobiota bacterium]
MSHGLSAETLGEIARVLAAEPDVERAILYGSRAKGTQRPGSDIDLVVSGPRVTYDALARIFLAFDEGPLPYRFDIAILERIEHAALLEHIARVGIPVYERATATLRSNQARSIA